MSDEMSLHDAIAAQYAQPALHAPTPVGGLRPADWAVLEQYAASLPPGPERVRMESLLLGTPKSDLEREVARSRAAMHHLLDTTGLTDAGQLQLGYILAAHGVSRER